MGTISLEGLDFYAYHGFYDEERKLGNHYIVDVELEVDFGDAAETDHLEKTVDYGKVYDIVKDEMAISSKLLEHIAKRILKRLQKEFPQVETAVVSISKMQPPLNGVCNKAKITLREDFHS